MTRLRHLFLFAFALLLLVRPGVGCSFEVDDTPSHIDPDAPYADFVGGKLGVVSGELRVRHLVVAYNTLSGRGLTPGERKAAIDADRFFNYGGGIAPELISDQWSGHPPARSGAAAWSAAMPQAPTQIERRVPGDNYQTFFNCLDDAFARAASTLADRRAHHNQPGQPDSPEVKAWIEGQLAVFSNCSDLDSPRNPGNGQSQAKPSTFPAEAPANAPLWLRQDRAYQIAAAHFYALDYDAALSAFRAIAQDKASPWSQLSRYLVARTLIRRATVPYKPDYSSPANESAAKASVLQSLTAARDQLQSIVRDPAMSAYNAPAQHLLDYVQLRLDPAAQANELARRLTAPSVTSNTGLDLAFRQNLIDLSIAYNSLPNYVAPLEIKPAPGKPLAPLLAWMRALGGPGLANSVYDEERDAQARLHNPPPIQQQTIAAWNSTRQPQWLAALLAAAAPGTSGLDNWIAAARNIPATSPAYATVTYHRLRLQAHAESFPELSSLMPSLERTQPRSAINLFADLRAAAAPTLAGFLGSSTRITPVSIQAEPGEGEQPPAPGSLPSGESPSPIPAPAMLCGVPLQQPSTPHLATETATIFNLRMPLRLLRDAALSPLLPANIRFTVAHMAWTRAILLDDFTTARALGPYLAQCQPAFKPWLDSYAAASTAEQRHVAGLLALMRFTSAEPTVQPWTERDFASYDFMRDNWWCNPNAVPEGFTPETASAIHRDPMFFNSPVPPESGPGAQLDPPFLTPEDRAQANAEIATLRKVGDAGDYFAIQALAWERAHPTDPHNPDVLGFAERVVRNACRSNATKELNHQLFDTIHRRYPQSEWAIRYKTWE